ncbi:SLC13 family permease [Patulibacter minatonensis]|uniref:SLC13 family permease n=1 Tax=Patulibacter minatonensis TaxID=298163 RepID=UPI0004B6D352|nr:SLC13 family permease [Patulibacter minatonensis]
MTLGRGALGRLAKQHFVVLIAFVAAAASCVAVPPDGEYGDYFETRTLMCLFCTMAVIAALDNVHFISALAGRLVRGLGTRRRLILGLVYATALWAMLISNDMALLTFLPLTYVAFDATGNQRYLAFTFIMETAAANLGGMLTPFGSPQNLFLYSFYEIPAGEFFGVMAIPFAVSMLLITVICLRVQDDEIRAVDLDQAFRTRPTVAYLGLFLLAILIVFRVLPVWTGFVVPAALLVLDRSALVKLDYGLMLTFVLFFVFSGNLARIDSVSSALGELMDSHVLLWSTLGSQVISNVPSAILFAQFTDDYRELLVGVNIGGVGTVVGSLASLIALAKYREYQPGRTGSFLVLFSLVNFGLLVVLFAVMSLAFAVVL